MKRQTASYAVEVALCRGAETRFRSPAECPARRRRARIRAVAAPGELPPGTASGPLGLRPAHLWSCRPWPKWLWRRPPLQGSFRMEVEERPGTAASTNREAGGGLLGRSVSPGCRPPARGPRVPLGLSIPGQADRLCDGRRRPCAPRASPPRRWSSRAQGGRGDRARREGACAETGAKGYQFFRVSPGAQGVTS